MHMHAAGVGAIQQYISRFGVFFDPARVLFCVRVTQARYAANMRGAAQRSAAQRTTMARAAGSTVWHVESRACGSALCVCDDDGTSKMRRCILMLHVVS
jgi:hypothetical protein